MIASLRRRSLIPKLVIVVDSDEMKSRPFREQMNAGARCSSQSTSVTPLRRWTTVPGVGCGKQATQRGAVRGVGQSRRL